MKSEVFNGSRFWTYFKYDLMQMWRNHVKAAILIGFSGLILYVLGISFNALIDKVWQAPSFSARAVVFMIAIFTIPHSAYGSEYDYSKQQLSTEK